MALSFDECVNYVQTGSDTSTTSNCNITTYPYPSTSWVYYGPSCTCAYDKTGKALSILKALMDKRTIEVKSVRQFIGLLEQIKEVL